MLVDPRSTCMNGSASWLSWIGPRFLAASRTAEVGDADLFKSKKPGMIHLGAKAFGRAMIGWSIEVGYVLRMELDDFTRAQSGDLAAADFIDRISYVEKSTEEKAIHFQVRAESAIGFYRRLSVLLDGATNRDICLLVARLNRGLAHSKVATVVVDLHMLDTVEAALLQHDETIRSMLETGKLKLDPDAAALRVTNILDRHGA